MTDKLKKVRRAIQRGGLLHYSASTGILVTDLKK